MTPKKRIETALGGGKPDRLPVMSIYDVGYMYRSLGKDQREFITGSSDERIAAIEESFRRHDVDGFFVPYGVPCGYDANWRDNHEVEKRSDYWVVTNKQTGIQRHLLQDCCWAEVDGTPIPRAPSAGGMSRITYENDIDKHMRKTPTTVELQTNGTFDPLRHLTGKYPDHHFNFEITTPMVMALNCCGGYVEGLLTMKDKPALFKKMLQRSAESEIACLSSCREAGASSVLFASYYIGADTISPKDYAERIFPYDLAVCQAAKAAGLFVLNWYLGDLMPMLDKVMELPIDALVLEQGRKGYQIDPEAIRRCVGDDFCLFGFSFENDFCTFNRQGLSNEICRQIKGTAINGVFIVGTPIIPPNAQPEAVDFYFVEARYIGCTVGC